MTPPPDRLLRTTLAVAVLLAASAATVGADDGSSDEEHDSVAKALKRGDYGVTLRYRYEHVDQDGFDKDANASTLRTTLWYRSAGFHGLRAYLEFEDVSDLGLDDQHNDTFNGVTDRPVIADPAETEINQATLGYTGLTDTELTAGRQEIVLDDARFVGDVQWRQNRQSYDAVRLTQESIPRTTLTYAFLTDVNTVRGVGQGLDGHAVNAAVDLDRYGTATAYYYRFDFDGMTAAALSSASLGASWHGTARVGEFTVPFRLEAAQQDDVGDNPATIDAGYRRGIVGLARDGWTVTLGYEVLEGSPADGAFTTPLATLFKHNGWADKFTATPDTGLRDLYVSGTYEWSDYSAIVTYHAFDADTGGADYGSELDARFVYTAPWRQQFLAQVALFDGDEGFDDTTKFWLMTRYAF